MFKNKESPTLYKQSYGGVRLVSNYGNGETLPDCKFSCEKDIYCTDKAWVTSKLRNHKVYVDTEVKSQQLSQRNEVNMVLNQC